MECMSIVVILGSSPRMRGTRVHDFGLCHNAGIIPAYAGNTNRCRTGLCLPRDHPRVCGEHGELVHVVPTGRGSSPRMRGTRESGMADYIAERIIPAYAGNTCPAIRKHSPTRDHPRVCGEHALSTVLSTSSAGSSPRMRGTPTCADYEIPWRGIIPAYAGNTQDSGILRRFSRDHPRVCGEHTSRNSSRRRMTGSSPRMRGTRHRRSVRSLRAGIIPAYAGNTGWYVSRYAARRDHPRVCGEHEPLLLPKLRTLGSSPRMRGTPHPVGSGRPHPGIIPAYAGNTMAEL